MLIKDLNKLGVANYKVKLTSWNSKWQLNVNLISQAFLRYM